MESQVKVNKTHLKGGFSNMVAAVVQLVSHVQLFATQWAAACQAPLPSTIFWDLFKFTSIESVMLSNHLILCHSSPFALILYIIRYTYLLTF